MLLSTATCYLLCCVTTHVFYPNWAARTGGEGPHDRPAQKWPLVAACPSLSHPTLGVRYKLYACSPWKFSPSPTRSPHRVSQSPRPKKYPAVLCVKSEWLQPVCTENVKITQLIMTHMGLGRGDPVDEDMSSVPGTCVRKSGVVVRVLVTSLLGRQAGGSLGLSGQPAWCTCLDEGCHESFSM